MKRSEMKRSAPMSRGAVKRPESEPKVRLRRCAVKSCRAPFTPRSMTHKTCSPECALAHVEAEKARKSRKERQEGLTKLKRRADYLKDAQNAFNAFIRFRDQHRACISSGVPLALEAVGGGYDAGHYRSIGSAPHLRFDERNVHGQSKRENRYLAGNATAYRRGLIERIGLAAVEALEADDTPRKYDIDQLKAIRLHYTAKLRELKGAA